VVVPYGDLHGLPFHAFRVGGRAIIETADVSYSPNVRTAVEVRPPSAKIPRVYVVEVAHPSLAAVSKEIGTLRALYGLDLEVVEPQALPEWLAAPPRGGGILHVAGHGVYQARSPSFSGISLGGRFLLARDIQEMSLDLDLVVLSGCETGRSMRVGGDEVIGMPGALLSAGVRAVLGSLWSVEDAGTAEFMARFHEGLHRGLTARAAVAETQRALVRAGVHPACWAAFMMVGEASISFHAPSSGPCP
jgi:CHAT domain-containing protein